MPPVGVRAAEYGTFWVADGSVCSTIPSGPSVTRRVNMRVSAAFGNCEFTSFTVTLNEPVAMTAPLSTPLGARVRFGGRTEPGTSDQTRFAPAPCNCMEYGWF